MVESQLPGIVLSGVDIGIESERRSMAEALESFKLVAGEEDHSS